MATTTTPAGEREREGFKPIPIRPAGENRWLFAVRCAVDLQLATTHAFLARELPRCRGRVLDLGAGEAPWRELLGPAAEYVGVDVESAGSFGMQRRPEIVYYDGLTLPFADASFEHVMSSEGLEHVPDPGAFLDEAVRVLAPGGTLILTVPWSARLHHLPHDYHRFTRFALQALLEARGLALQRLEPRGNDVAVVANKTIVMRVRLLRPARTAQRLWTWPLALLLAPVASGFLLAAHLSMRLGLGSADDPLGYALVAARR